ncbi:MAG TPA: ZIP family metal transporter [Candidatus Methylomirabilis sp.]|nr:ZIP family metal transporter [Candidatus Methylomirabilis sp.]
MSSATLAIGHRHDSLARWVPPALFAVAVTAIAWALVAADERIAYGAVASLAAGLATAAGALPIFATRSISQRAQDTMLGFGAGVMLAATSFSLIVPGVETAQTLWGSRGVAAGIAAAGMLAGALFLWAADRFVPHEHFIKGTEGADGRRIKQIWLFVFAITLHNFPEGLAVGVAFGGGEHAEAASLATGIGIQNMPEGLAVALALMTVGYSRLVAFALAAATGLVEPLAGLLGATVVTFTHPLLPFALTFAAGAMLFVISHEIIPESHRHGHEQSATLGVTGGFVTMMLLDTALA